jgi:hypothetical protein
MQEQDYVRYKRCRDVQREYSHWCAKYKEHKQNVYVYQPWTELYIVLLSDLGCYHSSYCPVTK